MTDSRQLLAEYVAGSESAFRELVARYIDMVYSVAIRRVQGQAQLAEDIAQTVFIDLARKARKLSNCVPVGGWLHRHTCFVAAKALRRERRRQFRERQAAEMNALKDHSEANLNRITIVLDEAIDQLGADDRCAILLRFFEQRDFRAVGEAMGSSEEAARKRVNRAVEKLALLLRRRGVAFSAAGLATLLAGEAVSAAPAGVATTLATTALAGAATGAGSTLTILKLMTMTKLQFGIITAVVVAGVATPLVIQHYSQAGLREENQALLSQLSQFDQLQVQNRRLAEDLARVQSSLSNNSPYDLLRLRAEVAQLRPQRQLTPPVRRTDNLPAEAHAAMTPHLETPMVAEAWTNLGTATPRAAYQTFRWALANRDANTLAQTVAWDPAFKTKAQALFDAAPESVRSQYGSLEDVLSATVSKLGPTPMTGPAVISEEHNGEDGTIVEQHQTADGRVGQNSAQLHQFDDGWRVVMDDTKLLSAIGETLYPGSAHTGRSRNGQ